jgi:hypothetical protein
MNHEHIEKRNAILVARTARSLAVQTVRSCDSEAATVAILVRALELATPDLGSQARAGLFGFRQAGAYAGCEKCGALS